MLVKTQSIDADENVRAEVILFGTGGKHNTSKFKVHESFASCEKLMIFLPSQAFTPSPL